MRRDIWECLKLKMLSDFSTLFLLSHQPITPPPHYWFMVADQVSRVE